MSKTKQYSGWRSKCKDAKQRLKVNAQDNVKNNTSNDIQMIDSFFNTIKVTRDSDDDTESLGESMHIDTE